MSRRKLGKFRLPPMVGAVHDGTVSWRLPEDIDYDMLGYFLSCHLIIEHYLTKHLKSSFPKLAWDDTKLSFHNLTCLLSGLKPDDNFDPMPAIKHMNAVRNMIGNTVGFNISDADFLPFAQFLNKLNDDFPPSLTNKEVLSVFTLAVCSYFAGSISSRAVQKG